MARVYCPSMRCSVWLEGQLPTVVLPPQEPNPEDPLNKEAAEVLQTNRRLFEQNVHRSLRGGYVGSIYFERCLK